MNPSLSFTIILDHHKEARNTSDLMMIFLNEVSTAYCLSKAHEISLNCDKKARFNNETHSSFVSS